VLFELHTCLLLFTLLIYLPPHVIDHRAQCFFKTIELNQIILRIDLLLSCLCDQIPRINSSGTSYGKDSYFVYIILAEAKFDVSQKVAELFSSENAAHV
jgi:hypothetical protein